jgi:hypothetical protein
MSRQIQIGLLAVLLVVFGFIVYERYRPREVSSPIEALQSFKPLPVENPALRLDLLDDMKKFEYRGSKRNIFIATAPPPPPSPVVAARPAAPAAPPPPPAVVVPATFFGYVTDAHTGSRRAFFSEGDDVFVVGIGDVLLGRFRLLQIGNNTAEMEEVASGRHATLTMELPGPS